MNRDYKLAAYALALAAAFFIISGAVVVSGVGPNGVVGDIESDGGPTQTVDGTSTPSNASERYDVSVAESSNETLTFTSEAPPCGGTSRVDASEYTRTDAQIGDTTVTLVYDDDTPFDEIDHRQFAAVVWSDVSNRAALDEYDRVEIRVTQYYETVDRERPLDAAGVTVRPSGRCVPYVSGEVDLHDEAVTVHRTLPAVDGLELEFTDTIGVLSEDEKELIEDLVASNDRASYNVRSQFDDRSTLEATVLAATNDGEIDIELTAAGDDGNAVHVTVDIDEETVVQSSMVLEIDESNIVSDGSDAGTTEISIETNGSDSGP